MDDLLDLSWSAPAGGAGSGAGGQKPMVPSLPAAGKPGGGGSQFDFLAKTSGTTSTSSPNYYSTSNTPRSSTPTVRSPPMPSAPPPKPASSSGNGNDAFSSLLGMGAGSSGSKNMTLAERQAQMADEKKRKDEHERQQFAGLGQWDQLGVKPAATPASAFTPLQPTSKKPASSFDALLQPISRPSSSSSRTSGNKPAAPRSAWHDDDDDDFMVGSSSSAKPMGSALPPKQTDTSPQAADPWDFDQLAAAAPKSKHPVHQARAIGSSSRNGGGSGMRTPDPDFDFGEWRDEEEGKGILGGSADSSDDELPASRPPPRQSAPPRSTAGSTRTASPPPHVVGQIVEMGFSPLQARQALAKTSNGLDVQSALDSLLADAFQPTKSNARGRAEDDLGEADDDYVERERVRREEEEKERRRRRRQGPSRETVRARPPHEQQRDGSGPGTPIQADQILAQASEIGQNVFSRATSLWNTGKERAMKALEEQRKAYEAQQADSKKGKVKDGRPRWMVEAEERDAGEDVGRAEPASSGFKDSDDDEGPSRPAPTRPRQTNGDRPSASSSRRPQADPPAERYLSTKEKADLLFADEPKKYVSPARHRKPAAAAPATARPTATPPAPLPARTLVPADPSAVQASAAHKTKGNEHFKLGRFTEAETAYSAGIRQLPEGHLHLVPLHNNRAATRLKLGESTGAAEDCTIVITLIGPAYHPSKEAPLPAELASEVKLAESFVKAFTKRAQAWEMGEKWPKAVDDWEKIMGFDTVMLGSTAASTRNLAAEGLRRSKRMIEGSRAITASAPPRKPAAKKPATPVPSKPSNVNDSEAVVTLRAAAKALEAEDQQRLQLKDSVEARINSWKGGKEANLRALLASLDTVLWDEVLAGGLKVGMHELIAEKQVKIKYMKVIARLHPDKLDVNKTTVEQRMLANGAFGTLNEAWQAFNNA